MHYTSFILAALASTGAIALPTDSDYEKVHDNEIKVILRGGQYEPWRSTELRDAHYTSQYTPADKLFETVELKVGRHFPNQALRCKVLDEAGNHIVVKRNGAIDHTFADGGLGKWSFKTPTKVSQVICSKDFKIIDADAVNKVKVILKGYKEPVYIDFNEWEVNGRVEKEVKWKYDDYKNYDHEGKKYEDWNKHEEYKNYDHEGKKYENQPKKYDHDDKKYDNIFSTVLLQVGPGIHNQALRCQAVDKSYNPLRVLRAGNEAGSFADGGKGEWTFRDGKVSVAKIICDPAFKN